MEDTTRTRMKKFILRQQAVAPHRPCAEISQSGGRSDLSDPSLTLRWGCFLCSPEETNHLSMLSSSMDLIAISTVDRDEHQGCLFTPQAPRLFNRHSWTASQETPQTEEKKDILFRSDSDHIHLLKMKSTVALTNHPIRNSHLRACCAIRAFERLIASPWPRARSVALPLLRR